MSDIKQKFINILFDGEDEEEEEVVADAPIADVRQETKKEASSVKAADLMYKKPQSAFIDVDEKPISAKELLTDSKEEDDEEYVLSPQLSPIFGIINNNGEAVHVEVSKRNEEQVKKPEDVHLDIIPSPIYGYGNSEESKHNFDEETYINKDIRHIFNDDVDDETIVVDQEINLFEDFEDYK
ncbi:MAG: hypothetical protein KBT35_01835 [Firmicutes bacterium]|nr:hypothetical protein [Candidatus Colivicinus equi]